MIKYNGRYIFMCLPFFKGGFYMLFFGKKFVTERLIIREYKNKDLEGFLNVVRQPEIYAATYGIPKDYTMYMAKYWFRMIKKNMHEGTAYEFAVTLKDSGKYIGNVGLINITNEHNHADISYYIDREYMNMGYATEAAREMIRYGFETYGYNKIAGVCMSCNPASRRVMEKIGMIYEGTLCQDLFKDGKYYDIDRLSILRSEYYRT